MATTSTIFDILSAQFGAAFKAIGADAALGTVRLSDRPDLAQFQCNGALAAAKQLGQNPRAIAEQVIAALTEDNKATFRQLEIAGPGFINLSLTDEALAQAAAPLSQDTRLGCPTYADNTPVMVDYGGYNVAKELHIGHIRATLIGWSLVQIMRFAGHKVTGDVHLGDWGTQMGMLIEAVKAEQPDLPYFDPDFTGPYPAESPITLADLNRLYPAASILHKENDGKNPHADLNRQATAELQAGRPGYVALWQHFVNLSIPEIKADLEPYGVEFDLWHGESTVADVMPPMIAKLKDQGTAIADDGAWIIPIQTENGKDLAPVMLVKRDGGVTYHTSDMGTIVNRVENMGITDMLYVVDGRQSFHFKQVFAACYKGDIVPPEAKLEHIAFGTINGPDGKPFKTRSGETVKLKDVTKLVTDAAAKRLAKQGKAQDLTSEAQAKIAQQVGMAAIKFADLSNTRTTDYVLDLDAFSSFEGKTGPYLLYSVIRLRSILAKAAEQQLNSGEIKLTNTADRALALQLLLLPKAFEQTYMKREPHHLCTFLFELAQAFSRFYNDCHIMDATDPATQAGWLRLCELTLKELELGLTLLGIDIPERM